MITRSRQRVTKMAIIILSYCSVMATVSVTVERYNEDEVGVSVWVCPIRGGGRVVWCGPCLRLKSGCVLMCRRGSGWLCRGEGGGGHSSAHGTDSTCQLNRW